MKGSSFSASNGGLLFVIGEALSCKEGSTTLRDLKDDRRLDVSATRDQQHAQIQNVAIQTVQLLDTHWLRKKK